MKTYTASGSAIPLNAVTADQMYQDDVVQEFHDLFYDTNQFTSWLGVPLQKNPMDLLVYQEILWDTKPDLLIECGTQTGGSAWFYATVMDMIGNGRVISIDIAGPDVWLERPEHDRIEYVTADSKTVDPAWLREQAGDGKVMVSLDSDHSYEHVLAECDLYGPLVTPGCYMVVEDTNLTGAAMAAKLTADMGEFEVDRDREKYLLTFHPGGWLRKR